MPPADIAIHSNRKVAVTSPWGFPLREDVAFTDATGTDAETQATRARTALHRLQDLLRKVLEPDEVVLYFSRGQLMPGRPERYLLGVPYRILTRAGLVLTNQRLIHLTLKRDGKWNRKLRSVRWSAVKEFRLAGGWLRGKLHLTYRNGSSESYWHIPKAAADKITVLMEALIRTSRGEALREPGMVSFCPQCFAELTPGLYACSKCGLKFKNEKGAVLHGLTIPGGAYFYAELHLLGIAHAFVDVSVLASAIAAILVALGRVQPPVMGGAPPSQGMFLVSAVFLTATSVLDIWLAIRVARSEVRNFVPIS